MFSLRCFSLPFCLSIPFWLQLDDALAEEVAPGCGGAAGLQAQLLRKHQAATAQANQQAVEEALMAQVSDLVDCSLPDSMVKEMGQQQYQARLLEAQAKVWDPPSPSPPPPWAPLSYTSELYCLCHACVVLCVTCRILCY